MAKLAQQIAEVEQRAASNRELTRVRYDELKQTATSRLIQPKTLGALFVGGTLVAFLTGSRSAPPDSRAVGISQRGTRLDQVTQLISTLARASVIVTPLLKWFQSRKTVVTKKTEPPPGSTAAPAVEETVIKES